jgi:polygalacturonase
MKNQKPSRRNFLKAAGQSLALMPLAATVLCAEESHAKPPRQTEDAKPASHVRLNVRQMGAIGDGKTKDTAALQMTLDRCSMLGGGEVVVPAGNYLTGALVLRSGTTLHLEQGAALHASPDLADYALTQVRWEGKWVKGYMGFISATDAENIAITGPGKIEGSPAFMNRVDPQTGYRWAALLEFTNCRNVRVEGCQTLQYGMWAIHPVYCENLAFKQLSIQSGADGIDVDSCKHVVIDGCTFDTGDDCISLKSGRGEEGYTLLRTTEDVHISNCTFSDQNFACIGIGSETSGGIRNARIEHCKFLYARSHAVYIKSRPGRGAFIEDIAMSDLDVRGAQQGFLRLNFLSSGKHDEDQVPGMDGIPTVRNYHFDRIHVEDLPLLVKGDEIDARKPLDGFSLTNVTGTCHKGILLANMRNVVLDGIQVTGYEGPLLSTAHVSGSGLNGAVALPDPPAGEEVAAPATPYVLR